MSEPRDPERCARTARYFDGELPPEAEADALAHLATCASCQAELGDLMGLEVATTRGAADKAAPPAPARAAARRTWLIAGVGATALAAAAAVAVVATRQADPPRARPDAIALAPERGVEARFSAPAFAAHRRYAVDRAGPAREAFSLATLAELERRGERAALAAAQASAGELASARRQLEALPASPDRDADLAAVALLEGAPEAALEAADRALAAAPRHAAARWNRALALRDLGLPMVASAELRALAATDEAGWADEARARAEALAAPVQARAAADAKLFEDARAMVARTGPALGDADVQRWPGYARLYFHDALRSASSADEARALAPLADALDRHAGTGHARAALDAVVAADFAARAPLAAAYRAMALGQATPEQAQALLGRLARAGAAFDDLRLGALVLAGAQAHLAEVSRLAVATGDPWFELLAARERAVAAMAEGARDRAEAILADATARCDGRAIAHRCGALAYELAQLYNGDGRFAEGEHAAATAVASFAAAGSTGPELRARAIVAETQRGRGRLAIASASFDELRVRAEATDCATARYAAMGMAMVAALGDADARARAPGLIPPIDACALAPMSHEVALVVDLARMSERDDDVARARAWIDAARAAGDPALAVAADVATARLDAARPAAGGDVAARLRALADAAARVPDQGATRAWLYATLVDDAGARGAWAEVVAAVAEEAGVAAPRTCALAVSVDDTRGTAAALDARGAATGARATTARPGDWTGAALVPPALRDALAGCATIAVLARPPVHGRADLLPPALPWAFASPRPAPPPPPAPPGPPLIVGDVTPPPALGLPALAPLQLATGATTLRGAEATPERVLRALATATYAELHVHGQVDLGLADASFLALSPGADQRWALTAGDVRGARLTAAPTVVLAACRAAETAPFVHARWSLPDAFIAAGARAVIAPAVEIPDAEAAAFFAALRRRIAGGEAPAVALAALRAAYVAKDPASWAASVVVFE